MLKPPASSEGITTNINGKEYHWCNKHQVVGQHTTSECKGLGIKPTGEPAGNQNGATMLNQNNNDKYPNRRLALNRAMESIAEDQK
jgi:hypothetical protein